MTFVDISLLQYKGNNKYYYDKESLTVYLNNNLTEVTNAIRVYYDDFTEDYVTEKISTREASAILIDNGIAFE